MKAPLYSARLAVYDKAEREEIVRLYIDNLWAIAHLSPDLLTVINSIYQAIQQGRVIVVERDGKIIGCTSFVQGTYWYSPKACIFDTGFFIVAEYRKTRASSILFNALKAEAVKRDAHLVMGAGTKDKTVAPIMAKRYPQIGSAFLVTH